MNSSVVARVMAFKDTLAGIDQPGEGLLYSGALLDYSAPSNAFPTRIVVKNIDCLDECALHTYTRIGLLNMASEICPGGGVRKGSSAQEEDICRRTTLYPTLARHAYPLGAYELIYSPGVEILKNAHYVRVDPPRVAIDVLSMAALRRPSVIGGTYAYPEDRATMRKKAHMLLQTAAYHRLETLVLGAWGCGAFANPPKEVARIFKDLLSSEFNGTFKHVTFAILEKESCGKLNTAFKASFRGGP